MALDVARPGLMGSRGIVAAIVVLALLGAGLGGAHGPMDAAPWRDFLGVSAISADMADGVIALGLTTYGGQTGRQGVLYILEPGPQETWNRVAALQTRNVHEGAYFGYATATDNGRVAAIDYNGAYPSDRTPSGFVFAKNATGAWAEEARLPGVYLGNLNDVDLSGGTVVLGDASLGNVFFAPQRGAAYVYDRVGGNWTRTATLQPVDTQVGDGFGYAVALDGDIAVVGAPFDDVGTAVDRGSVYVYERSGGQWMLRATLPGSAAGSRAGEDVALDGTLLGFKDRVAGYRLFRRDVGGAWNPEVTLRDVGSSNGGFALDGDGAIVGATIWGRGPLGWSAREILPYYLGPAAMDGSTVVLGGGWLGFGPGASVNLPSLYKEARATGARIALAGPLAAVPPDGPERLAADTGTLWTATKTAEHRFAADEAVVEQGPLRIVGLNATARATRTTSEAQALAARVTFVLPDASVLEVLGLESRAAARCGQVEGTVAVGAATLNGQPLLLPALVPANTGVDLPGMVRLVLNSQRAHGTNGLEVDGLRLEVPGLADIAVASAIAGLENCERAW